MDAQNYNQRNYIKLSPIPPKIHYCWFGRGEMPELAIKCLNSWKKYLPGYELIIWNEDNFDIYVNEYVKEAYETKKYAFVTDYVRLYALYQHGGIYMDTDVEVLKSLDDFLIHRAFIGCEHGRSLQTSIIGAEANHPWIKKILDTYQGKRFILSDGRLNTVPNPQIFTQLTVEEYGWIPENQYQLLIQGLNVYPIEYFCAKDFLTGKVTINDNTHTIHHFSGSWATEEERITRKRKDKIMNITIKILGKTGFQILKKIITPSTIHINS